VAFLGIRLIPAQVRKMTLNYDDDDDDDDDDDI